MYDVMYNTVNNVVLLANSHYSQKYTIIIIQYNYKNYNNNITFTSIRVAPYQDEGFSGNDHLYYSLFPPPFKHNYNNNYYYYLPQSQSEYEYAIILNIKTI